MKNKYKAIIFDFDGVILDSGRIKTEAFPLIFDFIPEHHDAILDYHIQNQGLSRYEKIDWVYRELLDKPLEESKKKELGQKFSDIVLDKVLEAPFINGAKELLQFLINRELPSFVASGTPEDELRLIVEKRGLDKYFNGVYGSPTKKPEIVRHIEKKWNIACAEMLFLGDASTDYNSARITGTDFVPVQSDEMKDYWKLVGLEAIDDLKLIINKIQEPDA